MPWKQCRSIGFVSNDGVVHFSENISSETSLVCIILVRGFSAATRRAARHEGLACVSFPLRY